MIDREQTRRDAEWLAGTDFNVAADRLAVAVPALLAELEQAEQKVRAAEEAVTGCESEISGERLAKLTAALWPDE